MCVCLCMFVCVSVCVKLHKCRNKKIEYVILYDYSYDELHWALSDQGQGLGMHLKIFSIY